MDYTLLNSLTPAIVSFIVGIAITPLVTHYLYACKAWKKQGGKIALSNGQTAEVFNMLKGSGETHTPRMGGIIIWASTLLTLGILYLCSVLFPDTFFEGLAFLSKSQTLIPTVSLIVGAGIGFLNDFYDIKHGGEGLRLRSRLLLVVLLATALGWWFYEKLDVTSVSIPFDGAIELGIFIIPFFVILTVSLYASGVIDGIDGLSGGVFASVFSAYAGIALVQHQYDLAAFCAAVAGGILAFLWFNIPPARFWMTETGSMALTLSLATVVFMTDTLGDGNGITLLPVVGFLLVITVLSNIVQILYRKTTGKKFFQIAPIHHHFEAIGWPSYKVTMRYWVVSIICALLGVAIAAVA
jgi:phospho-N-acetylmuramoyl-pentapeptide-transferase